MGKDLLQEGLDIYQRALRLSEAIDNPAQEAKLALEVYLKDPENNKQHLKDAFELVMAAMAKAKVN